MKKIFIFLYLSLFLFQNKVFAEFQTQWFAQFNESENWITFDCKTQCFIILWKYDKKDFLNISWKVKWKWILGYWFLNGQQIVPGETLTIDSERSINDKFLFSKLQFISQVPSDMLIILIVQGEIRWDGLKILIWNMSFWEKIKEGFNEFWQNETLTPYSINLRYWAKIFWVSIEKIWYILFFLISIIWFFLINKKKRFDFILYVFLILFLSIFLRNLVTYTFIFNEWRRDYVNKTEDEKRFFDLWDYLAFTKKIRETLELDNMKKCSVYIDSIQEWPFSAHWEAVYLKPCEVTKDTKKADFLIYFKKSPTINWNVILEFNQSYILKK
ncbi:MAG: hypothetical protein ACD_4C00394G0003 [uncultured bacterium (gcode 4)]|uniref:Uncharacterized protein n=1 Tax=uncultured bacterium (gcode 4) TaxID=1234023 RepID=K2FTH7_9BACT|nr:MAG: hypothetical protein ACD_4C00394G0003 [uncultured bacterium (gcode 4)]